MTHTSTRLRLSRGLGMTMIALGLAIGAVGTTRPAAAFVAPATVASPSVAGSLIDVGYVKKGKFKKHGVRKRGFKTFVIKKH